MAENVFTLQLPVNDPVTNNGLVLVNTTSRALTAPLLVDLTGDGRLEAVIGTNAGRVAFFKLNEDGQYEDLTGTQNDPFRHIRIEDAVDTQFGTPLIPAFADIDGDGDLDLFLGAGDGELFFFQNIGSATNPRFKDPIPTSQGGTGELNRANADRSTEQGNLFGITAATAYAAPTFVDINGDGRSDLFIGQYNNRANPTAPYIVYYQNTTQDTNLDGQIQLNEISFAPRTGADNPLNGVGPVNSTEVFEILYPSFLQYSNQQTYDVFIGQKNGQIIYYQNTGTVQSPNFVQRDDINPFKSFNELPGGSRGQRATIAFGDLTEDGRPDALVGVQQEEIGLRFFLNETLFPEIQVERLDTNQLVIDGTTLAITDVSFNQAAVATTFQITNVGRTTMNLGTPTIANPNLFTLNQTGFQSVLAPDETTSFTVALNSGNLNNLNSQVSSVVSFAVDDPNITQPFDFTVQGTVRASRIEVRRGEQVIADGTTSPIGLGTLAFGAPGQFTTFTITNNGLDNLILAVPTVDTPAFSLNTQGFNPVLAPNQSTSFGVAVNSANLGTFQGTVRFAANDPTISGLFDFAISGNVTPDGQPPTPPGPPVPPPAGDVLFYDPTSRLFRLGIGQPDNLEFRLTGTNAGNISEIRVSRFSATGELAGQQSLFSVLPGIFRPSGFGTDQQVSIFTDLRPGDVFGVDFISPNGVVSYNSPQLAVSQTAAGQYSLNFGDLSLSLRQTGGIPLGIQFDGRQTQLQPEQEILDLRGLQGNVRATFTLFREAAFTNNFNLYRIDDPSGRVNGIAPGEAGYAQAAIDNRVPDISFNVGNQNVAQFSSVFAAGALYAPFIVVNGTTQDLLAVNPQNVQGTSDIVAYFPFIGANPDRVDHVLLFGSNVIGFEDLPGGGDRDFNDLIVRIDVTPMA
ncbi:FG-GAP-like repeat-containing protein [Spirulina subsalsa]|uniref:FG-GAP-like repeat-containing protein n=1 Tax=Spirulina subsalsa TaxID=54311 RepID=UPI000310E466|nr:FG-GAP-like repeat-containing protein [Spirulina subsalsa]